MANQLAIPFKKSSTLPIRDAVSSYIRTNHSETHPEAFKWDMDRWEQLRADALADAVHTSRVHALIKYVAFSVFSQLTRLNYNLISQLLQPASLCIHQTTKRCVHPRLTLSTLLFTSWLSFIQIGLDISYTSAFDTLAPSDTLPNLSYERVSLLFNLAALYSQLAISENRSHPDGIKRANAYYQVLYSSILSKMTQ